MDLPGSGLCSDFSGTEPSGSITSDAHSTLLLVSQPTTFSFQTATFLFCMYLCLKLLLMCIMCHIFLKEHFWLGLGITETLIFCRVILYI
jgi:hypothetical protein